MSRLNRAAIWAAPRWQRTAAPIGSGDDVQGHTPYPTGYRLIWAGEFEDLEKAQKRLEVIVPISLALILVLR
jgi:hypothetical protein